MPDGKDGRSALEVLASLPERDNKTVMDALGLYEYYSRLVRDITEVDDSIKCYELMIKKNCERLGETRNKGSIAYDLGHIMTIMEALADPKLIIHKIDDYKKELEHLKRGFADLCEERDDLADKVDELIRVDGLTGLYNFRHFESRVKEEIARSRRNKECFVIAMADIDHFKEYNDTYGHLVGNEALKTVAKTLFGSIRGGDITERGVINYEDQYGRYGGEEFAFLLFGVPRARVFEVVDGKRANIEEADIGEFPQLAENLYCLMTKKYSNHVTASMGYFFFDPSEFEERDGNGRYKMSTNGVYNAIIKRADAALYAAKHAGRNCVKEFSPEMTQGTKN